jgi:hypothetical protein
MVRQDETECLGSESLFTFQGGKRFAGALAMYGHGGDKKGG